MEKNISISFWIRAELILLTAAGLAPVSVSIKKLKALGGALVCAVSNEAIRTTFHITRADEKIVVTDSRLEALKFLQDMIFKRSASI